MIPGSPVLRTGRSARRRSRRLRAPVAALVVALVLAACGGLPTSSDIQRGLPVSGDPVQGVHVFPDGPLAGAEPQEIIEGFLRANVGFTEEHDVARSFLTAELAEQWRPTARVLVHSGESDFEFTTPDENSVSVSADAEATLDGDGYYHQLPSGTIRTETFGLQRVAGQWRISSFPEEFGLWLSESDFYRLYRATNISYVSPVSRVFVPDVRWFPRGAGLATTLARAQMQPVPDYLHGAVMTGVPPGADLSVDAVPVESGVAVVDLTGGQPTDSVRRRALWAQFMRTLSQVPGVQQVTLQSEGRTLEVPGIPDSLADAAEVGYTEATRDVDYALLRTGTELQVVNPYQYDLAPYTPPTGTEVPELPEIPLEWVDPAASADVNQLAAVSAERTRLARWRDGVFYEMPAFGYGLTRPSFDGIGGLWVAGASATGSKVWVIDTALPMRQSVARPVEAPWLGEREVLDFRVASDNQRAVVLVHDPASDQYETGITGIVRGNNGQPRSLTAPMRVAPTLGPVTDVTWVDQTTVGVLGEMQSSDISRPYIVPLGGEVEAMQALEGALTIVGVPGATDQQVLVVNDRGRISVPDGTSWYSARVGTDLVIPGT